MTKNVILIAAVCAVIFFVSCGSDNKTQTPADDPDSAAESGSEETPDTASDTANDTDNNGNETDPGSEDSDTDPTDPTGDPTDEADGSEDVQDDEPVTACELSELEQELVGTWAQKVILRSASSTTFAQDVPSVTTRFVVVEIKPNADCKLDFYKKDERICRTDNRTGLDGKISQGRVGLNEFDGSKFNTVFNYWKPYQIPGHENEPYLEISENDGEKTFKLNKDWELRGANMDDPSIEPMISSDSDPRIFDHDEDGNPAFTVQFSSTLASGKMYYIHRFGHSLSGKVVSNGKIEGNVEWTDEQYAHQQTPNVSLRCTKTTVTETARSVFQLVKVDDSMDCATLLEKADEIFNIVDPNSDVPHNKYEE